MVVDSSAIMAIIIGQKERRFDFPKTDIVPASRP
jgi:hypothetical protein